MATLQTSELLCFMSTQYDKLDKTNLNLVLLKFYDRKELITAKDILVSVCENIGLSNHISKFKTKRNWI